MAKPKKYQKKPFESTGAASDTSANIYESMLLSAAWMDLSANQKALYLTCKAQYYAEKSKPLGDDTCFTMAPPKWADKYGLYSKNNGASFYRDIAELIEHGFIRCRQGGKASRTKTIYQFSDKWRMYGTPEFSIDMNERTEGMRDRIRKEIEKQEKSVSTVGNPQ